MPMFLFQVSCSMLSLFRLSFISNWAHSLVRRLIHPVNYLMNDFACFGTWEIDFIALPQCLIVRPLQTFRTPKLLIASQSQWNEPQMKRNKRRHTTITLYTSSIYEYATCPRVNKMLHIMGTDSRNLFVFACYRCQDIEMDKTFSISLGEWRTICVQRFMLSITKSMHIGKCLIEFAIIGALIE